MVPESYKYPLDITGESIDNLVYPETRTLTKTVRRIVPKEGAYFTKSLVVKHNGKVLKVGLDYKPVYFYREATEVCGAEICVGIYFKNSKILGDVELKYQVLGDKYSNITDVIRQVADTVSLDDRAVTYEQILNKPETFIPMQHLHHVNDLIGIGPFIVELQGIRRAIENLRSYRNVALYAMIGDVYHKVNNFLKEYDGDYDWMEQKIIDLKNKIGDDYVVPRREFDEQRDLHINRLNAQDEKIKKMDQRLTDEDIRIWAAMKAAEAVNITQNQRLDAIEEQLGEAGFRTEYIGPRPNGAYITATKEGNATVLRYTDPSFYIEFSNAISNLNGRVGTVETRLSQVEIDIQTLTNATAKIPGIETAIKALQDKDKLIENNLNEFIQSVPAMIDEKIKDESDTLKTHIVQKIVENNNAFVTPAINRIETRLNEKFPALDTLIENIGNRVGTTETEIRTLKENVPTLIKQADDALKAQIEQYVKDQIQANNAGALETALGSLDSDLRGFVEEQVTSLNDSINDEIKNRAAGDSLILNLIQSLEDTEFVIGSDGTGFSSTVHYVRTNVSESESGHATDEQSEGNGIEALLGPTDYNGQPAPGYYRVQGKTKEVNFVREFKFTRLHENEISTNVLIPDQISDFQLGVKVFDNKHRPILIDEMRYDDTYSDIVTVESVGGNTNLRFRGQRPRNFKALVFVNKNDTLYGEKHRPVAIWYASNEITDTTATMSIPNTAGEWHFQNPTTRALPPGEYTFYTIADPYGTGDDGKFIPITDLIRWKPGDEKWLRVKGRLDDVWSVLSKGEDPKGKAPVGTVYFKVAIRTNYKSDVSSSICFTNLVVRRVSEKMKPTDIDGLLDYMNAWFQMKLNENNQLPPASRWDMSRFRIQPGAESFSSIQVDENDNLITRGIVYYDELGTGNRSLFSPTNQIVVTESQTWNVPQEYHGRMALVSVQAASKTTISGVIHSAVRQKFITLEGGTSINIRVGEISTFGTYLSVANTVDYPDAIYQRVTSPTGSSPSVGKIVIYV